jgi:hypothetical protein
LRPILSTSEVGCVVLEERRKMPRLPREYISQVLSMFVPTGNAIE